MNDTSKKRLNAYADKASSADEETIRDNIGGMNRGPIRKIWESVLLLWEMVRDPSAPWKSKALAIGALVYLVSPIDAIPDAIPFFGLSDDVGVILAAVAALATDLMKYQKTK